MRIFVAYVSQIYTTLEKALKKIAALTMARNDHFFLQHWVTYYGGQLGKENLYVYLDGRDQETPDFCAGVQVEVCDKIPGKIVEMEKRRLAFLSQKAAELLQRYDLVIGCDADEYVLADPRTSNSLREYLSQHDIPGSLSPLGIDVGQNLRCEKRYEEKWGGLLAQRRYGRICTRYTKPVILSKPLSWGSGFHRIHGHNYHIAKDLYLFHFGYFDLHRIEARFSDRDRAAQGVKKHIAKRAQTIHINSTCKIRDWDKTVGCARRLQQHTRQPYCWNKPAMWELKWVVQIPDRFENLLE